MNNENKNLKEEILKTIIWFDLFSHPLTSYEIFKYVNYSTNLSDIIDELENLSDKVENKKGFYFFKGRESIVEDRFKTLNYFNQKIKKAKRFSRLISWWPFIQGIAVSNIIGDHNLRGKSDIDFFIITSSRRIWLTRFFCTFLAKSLGLRPNKKTKRNKICLSFYISNDNLDLENYSYNTKDLYSVYWLAGIEVIYNYKNIFSKFYKANYWVKKYLPNLNLDDQNLSCLEEEKNRENNFSFGFLDFLEKFSKKIQLRIMPKKLKDQVGKSSGVLLEDNIIKLFLEERRSVFIEKYEEYLDNIK